MSEKYHPMADEEHFVEGWAFPELCLKTNERLIQMKSDAVKEGLDKEDNKLLVDEINNLLWYRKSNPDTKENVW